VGFSPTLIVDADWLPFSGTLTLDPFGHQSSNSGTFLVKFGKVSKKLKIGRVDLKTMLKKIIKVSMFPPCASAYMTS